MVQELRLRRDPGRNSGRLLSSPLFLAGLLRCSLCGDTCQLESSGKLDPNGEPYRYYNCRRFCRTGKEACPGYRIAVDTLDSAILSHIAEHVGRRSFEVTDPDVDFERRGTRYEIERARTDPRIVKSVRQSTSDFYKRGRPAHRNHAHAHGDALQLSADFAQLSR